MPAVFVTFERTLIMAYLATYGPTHSLALAKAIGMDRSSMVLRLQGALRAGLVDACP